MNYKQTVLKVSGMSCHSCVSQISDTLTSLSGVQTVDIRMRDGSVVVEHDSDAISVETLVQVLGEDGYGAVASRDRA